MSIERIGDSVRVLKNMHSRGAYLPFGWPRLSDDQLAALYDQTAPDALFTAQQVVQALRVGQRVYDLDPSTGVRFLTCRAAVVDPERTREYAGEGLAAVAAAELSLLWKWYGEAQPPPARELLKLRSARRLCRQWARAKAGAE